VRFALTDEQEQLSEAVARAMAGADTRSPGGLWQELVDMGVLGLGLAEQRGGSGGGLLELALVAEQTGAALGHVPFASGPVMAGGLLRQLDSPESDALVARLTQGAAVVVAGETLPWPAHTAAPCGLSVDLATASACGALTAVPAPAVPDPDGPAPAGPVTVLALAGAGDAAALVAFRSDSDGVVVTPAASLDPSEPLAAYRLDRTPLTVLAEGHAATSTAAAAVAAASAVLALELCGTGAAIFGQAVGHAKTREQFGRPIGSFQSVKHLLADRYVELDAARAGALYACALADDDDPGAPVTAGAALAAATEAAHNSARDALQVFGGIGFTYEHAAHRYLRRTRARRALLGTPEQQLDALGAALAAHPS
jgi:acyl-CoA dehydrogenase